jgi:hypothetical protein
MRKIMNKPTRFHASAALLITCLAGCAASPFTIEDKYLFPEFEEVDSFSNINLMGWETIDNQSLIVQTSPSTWYLLILSRKMSDLNFAETLLLSSTGTRVEAKLDCVEAVGSSCDGIPVPIHTIYRLTDRSGIDYARNRIRSSR